MSTAVALALIACVLQIATAVVVFVIARAPDWQRARLFGFIALTAAIYSGVDIWAVSEPLPIEALDWVVRINLTTAGLHASAWLLYTFADASGSWRSLSPRVQRLALGNIVLTAVLGLSGLAIDRTADVRMTIPSLGVDYSIPTLTTVGAITTILVFSTLLVSIAEWVRRAIRGEPGAVGLSIGFSLFLLCALEEALVSSGALHFLFLSDLGYIFTAVPVFVQLVRRFTDDARRVAALSLRLADEVQARTQERDQARDALLQQERLAALGRFAAGVGHEVNNPLQFLMLSLEELRNSISVEERQRLALPLSNAAEGASRIRRVVDGLRTYAMPSSDRFVAVDINQVVRTAMRVASAQLQRVERVIADLGTVPPVLGDEGQLVQLLINPVVNAAQALGSSRAGGATLAVPAEIRVTTRRTESGEVEVIIADNGPGFAASVLPRLGEPYVTTRASDGGTGLGVFVTRGLVQSHGGRIAMQNAETGGAVVRIVLPASDEAQVVSATDSASSSGAFVIPQTSRRRVLLVDDEPQVLRVLSRGLAGAGYEVLCASGAVEALTLLDSEPVDVIVSDLMMPNVSGIELAARVAASHPALSPRLLLMTGGVVSEDAAEIAHVPADRVLHKPIAIASLVRRLQSLDAASQHDAITAP